MNLLLVDHLDIIMCPDPGLMYIGLINEKHFHLKHLGKPLYNLHLSQRRLPPRKCGISCLKYT